MATATLTKKAAEKFPIGFRLSAPDLDNGEVILSCSVTATTGLTIVGDPVIKGNVVSQVISGGTAGITYAVTFTITTSAGSIYVDDFAVTVS